MIHSMTKEKIIVIKAMGVGGGRLQKDSNEPASLY